MKKIYFCRKNDSDTKKLYKFLKTHYKGIKIERKDCLDECKTCKHCPFLVVDDDVVKGKSVNELYQEVNLLMNKEWKKARNK